MDCCLTGSLLLQINWLIDWLIVVIVLGGRHSGRNMCPPAGSEWIPVSDRGSWHAAYPRWQADQTAAAKTRRKAGKLFLWRHSAIDQSKLIGLFVLDWIKCFVMHRSFIFRVIFVAFLPVWYLQKVWRSRSGSTRWNDRGFRVQLARTLYNALALVLQLESLPLSWKSRPCCEMCDFLQHLVVCKFSAEDNRPLCNHGLCDQ